VLAVPVVPVVLGLAVLELAVPVVLEAVPLEAHLAYIRQGI